MRRQNTDRKHSVQPPEHINVRPIESRIASFDHAPTDIELGTDLGYGLIGSSNFEFSNDDKTFTVELQKIPMTFVMAVMLITIASMAVTAWWKDNDIALWGMALGGFILILPTFYVFLNWLNESMGDEPFIVLEKATNQVKLPRLSLKYSKSQLREIIALNRFGFESKYDNGNQFFQIGVLIEEGNGMWTYAHLFNTTGASGEIKWLGLKNEHTRIAEALDIKSRWVTFTKEESKSLPSQAPRFSQKASTSLTASPSNVS